MICFYSFFGDPSSPIIFFVSQIVALLCGELVRRVALADGRLLWELLLIFLGKGLISATVMNFDAELFKESAEVASLATPASSITEADGKLASSSLMLKTHHRACLH